MARAGKDGEAEALSRVLRHLEAGERALALAGLAPVLTRRATTGDGVAAVALRLLQEAETVAPDVVAASVDRLLEIVARQDAQIRALIELVETRL